MTGRRSRRVGRDVGTVGRIGSHVEEDGMLDVGSWMWDVDGC